MSIETLALIILTIASALTLTGLILLDFEDGLKYKLALTCFTFVFAIAIISPVLIMIFGVR